MKNELIRLIESNMEYYLDEIQIARLNESLKTILNDFEVFKKDNNLSVDESKENHELLVSFLSAKQIEGCSEKTIDYYRNTIFKMLESVNLKIESITTDDLRKYLADYKNQSYASKSTIDNIRRVLSSFFSWLEDEGHISKNPVRRIHRIKTKRVVKEVLSDENFEVLRDKCDNIRDLAMIELLASTGIHVGELVKIQRALKNNGYYLTAYGHYLKVDGIYWDYTVKAVKQFQKAKGLKVTGKVDEKTAKKLGLI